MITKMNILAIMSVILFWFWNCETTLPSILSSLPHSLPLLWVFISWTAYCPRCHLLGEAFPSFQDEVMSVWNGLTAFFSHYGYHTKLILCNFLFPLSLCCLKNCNSLGKWFYNVVMISSDSGTVPRFKQELRNIFRLCFCQHLREGTANEVSGT